MALVFFARHLGDRSVYLSGQFRPNVGYAAGLLR
jgi:hypothetical protein